jgi:hypothetical protein
MIIPPTGPAAGGGEPPGELDNLFRLVNPVVLSTH